MGPDQPLPAQVAGLRYWELAPAGSLKVAA